MIARLQDQVPTRIVACADWLAEEAVKGGMKNVSVIKNSVDREFWEAAARPRPSAASEPPGGKNLFLCRDLRDTQKVDWHLLRRIAALPGQSLTIVGDNAPKVIEGSNTLPALTDRSEIAGVMRAHDRLIFTSKVDYFPLTIAEAITAGLKIFAIDSRAAREFHHLAGVEIFATGRELLEALLTKQLPRGSDNGSVEADFFAPSRMTLDYLRHYDALTA